MIDNSAGFERRDTKNVLTNEAIERVIATYTSGDEGDGWAQSVTNQQIAAHHLNLTVRRYVSAGSDGYPRCLILMRRFMLSATPAGRREEAESRLEAVLTAVDEK
jgi:type I restriction-modification system DNA methylase subunit